MGIGAKITFALLGAAMLQQLLFNGPKEALFVFILFGIGCFLWECLQRIVLGLSKLFSGNPRVEYHFHVWEPEKGAQRHPDPTAPDPSRWDDIDMTLVNGVWRKR